MFSKTLLTINQIFLKEIGQNLIKENFIRDYFDKDWFDILHLDQQNLDLSIKSFLNNMNSILDSNAPFKKINKYN